MHGHKFVISLVDIENDEVLEKKEVPFTEGESLDALERRLRREITSLISVEYEDGGKVPPEKTPAPKSRNVSNAQLKKIVDGHEFVLQSVLRVLHSGGLISEPALELMKANLQKKDGGTEA